MKNFYTILLFSFCGIICISQSLIGQACNNYTDGGKVFQNQDTVVLVYCNTLTLLPITEIIAPTGGSGGGPEYQWQVSFNLGNSWNDIAIPEGLQVDLFANSNPVFNYLVSIGLNVNQTTIFRRGAKRAECTNFVFSNWVVFKVFQQISDPGNFKEEVTYCEYTDNNFCTPAINPGIIADYTEPTIPYNPVGGTVPYEFRWEISADELNWTFYSSEALPDLCFAPGIHRYFRRGVRPFGSPCNFIYSNTIEIKNVKSLVIDFDIVNPNCSDENTGIIQVFDLSGNDNYILNTFRYSIDGGINWQFSNTFSNLGEGDYNIIVDSKCACNDTPGVLCNGTATITATPAPEFINANYTDLTDCDANDGTISIIANSGIPPLLYSIDGFTWTNNSNFTNLPIGSYLVFVKNNDDSCERYYGTIDLQEPPSPTINQIITTDLTDCNSENGVIEINAVNGHGTFEYSIDGGAIWFSTNIFNGLNKADFTIGVRNFDGTCAVFQNASVNGPNAPILSNINTTQPSDCNLDNGSIEISATPGSSSTVFSIDGENSWQSSGSFSGLAPGNYPISIRNADGTCLVNDGTVIQLDYPPSPSILNVSSIQPTDCNLNDGTITITAGDGIGAYEFSINGGDSWQSSGSFSGLAPGNYAIVIRNADGTCVVNDGTVIQLDYPPSPSILNVSSSQPTDCNLDDGAIIITAGDGIGAYEFSINGGNSWQSSGSFSGLAPGNYPIAIRNADGTCVVNDGTVIQLDYPPSPSILNVSSSQPTDCNLDDGAIIITAGDGIGAYEFSINGGNSWQISGSFSGLAPGNYPISIRNADGTCVVNDGTVIQLDYPPSPSILNVSSSQPTDCNLDDGTINITGGGGIGAYEFSIDGGNSWQISGSFSGLAPGNYPISIRNADGTCLVNDGTVIQLDYPPSPSILNVSSSQPTDCNLDDGAIIITAGDGIGAYEFSINGGDSWQSSGSFSGLVPGNYAIAIRNADGTCVVNDGTVIQLDYPPSPNILNVSSSQPTDCNLDDGTITITAGDGIGAYEFSINGGNSWQISGSFPGLAPGNYPISIRNADGTCVINDGTVIQLDYPPSPSILDVSSSQPTDCNLDDGTITITAGAGIGAYEFSINGGDSWQSSSSFSGLNPGSYAIAIRNADGTCVINDGTVTRLDYPPSPNILDISNTQPTDCNLDDGTITITAGDGIGAYEFSIDGGNSWQSSVSFSGLAPGNYPISIRNADGTCVVNDGTVIQLDYPPSPSILNVSSSQPTDCNLDNGTITITAGDGIGAYEFSINGGNSWQSSGSFSGLAPGNYPIAIRNADGTCVVNDGTVIQLDYPPSPSILNVSNSQPTDCNLDDGAIIITAGDGIGAYEFSINGGDSWQSSGSFSGLAPGNYPISIRNADGTCLVNDGTVIQLDYPPSPSILNVSSSQPTDCNLDDGAIIITAGDGIGAYEFSINGGDSWQSSGSFSGLVPGNYAIAIRNADGTCVVNDGTVIQLDYPPSPSILDVSSTQPTDCNLDDGTITITAGDGIGAYEFSINGGDSWQSSGSFSGLAPGNYPISIRNADGTCVVNDGTVIQLDYPPSPSILNVSSSQPTDCNLDDGTITITAGDGIGTYEFSINGGDSWQSSGSFSGLAPGNYPISIRNADGTCVVNDGTVIQLDYPPSPSILNVSSSQPTDCNLDDGTITITAGDGVRAYEFSIDGGNSWQSSGSFSGLAPGNYPIAIRNADGTCAINDGTVIQLDYPPSPSILNVSSSQPTDCNLDDGAIIITAGDGIGAYEFSINGGDSWQSSGSFSGLAPGNYPISIRNADGTCVINDGTVIQLDYPPSPSILDISNTQPTDCNLDNGTITITAGDGIGAYEFSINGGDSWQSSGSFSGLNPGSYAIAIRNADGTCVVNDGTVIQLDYPPSPSFLDISNTQPTDCNLDDGTITITAGDGIGTYEFSINGGDSWQSSGSFSGLNPGSYAIIIRNADGTCVVNDGTVIQLDYPPSPSILDVSSSQPTDCNLDDGTITITAGDGIGAYEFSIDGGNSWQSSGSFSGLAPGNYPISIRNADGTCLVNDGTVIQLDYPPSPSILNVSSSQPTDCNLDDGAIIITAGDGIGAYEFSINGGDSWQSSGSFSGLAPGNYPISIRNADGTCVINDGTVIQLDYPPSPSFLDISNTQPTDCNLDDGTITITAGDGIGAYEFSISGGNSWQSSGSFSGLAPGNYPIVIRNTDGTCLVNDGTVIQLDYPPSPSFLDISNTQPTDCNLDDGTITITAGDGIGAYEFSISGGNSWQSSGSFSGLAPGNYPIVIRNTDGTCLVNDGTVIQLDYPPSPSVLNVSSSQPTDCNLDNGTINITAGDGIGAYEFSISGGNSWQSSGSFSGLAPGNYTISIRNADGTCVINDGTVIQLDYPPSPSILDISNTQPTDCNLDNGTITITAGDGIGAYEFSINGGDSWQGSNSYTGLAPESYAILVRNADGTCIVNDGTIIQLDYPASPQILEVSQQNPSDCGINDGAIEILMTEPTNNYSFSIDGGQSWQTSNIFTNLGNGAYQVMVSNINGTCPVNYGTIQLTGPSSPQIDFVEVTDPSDCGINDGTILFHVSGGIGTYQYSIDGGNNWSLNASFTGLPADTYLAAVRNIDETCTVSNASPILMEAPEAAVILSINPMNPTDCGVEDGRIDIVIEGDPTNFEFTINGGQTWIADNTFNFLPPGTYTAGVRRNNGQCETILTDPTILVEPLNPVILNVSVTQPTDCNLNNGSILITASAGIGSFEYSINNGISWQANNQFQNLEPGNYAVWVRNFNGTCPVAYSTTIELHYPNAPTVDNVLSQNVSDCGLTDGSIIIEASGGISPLRFSIDGGDSWQTSNIFTNLGNGAYQVMVSNINGTCPVNYGTIQLTGPSSPQIDFVEVTDPSDCGINDGTILFHVSGGIGTYQYSIDGGNSWSLNASFTGLPADTYLAAVRNIDETCAVSNASPILMEAPEAAVILAINPMNPTDCGVEDGRIDIVIEGDPTNFEFTINGGQTWIADNTFNFLPPGTYTAGVRRNNGQCETILTDPTILVEPPSPVILNVSVTQPTDCNLNNGSILITASAGIGSFEYSINNGISWQANNQFQNLEPGNYAVWVRNFNGTCPVAYSTTIELHYPNAPTIDNVLSQNVSDCGLTDGSIIIEASGGISPLRFSIDGGDSWQTSNIFTNLGNGAYQVMVSNINGTCPVNYGTIQLTGPSSPQIDFVEVTDPSDCGLNDGTILFHVSGGIGTYQYSIDGGNNWSLNASFTGLPADTYLAAVRNIDETCTVSNASPILMEEPEAAVILSINPMNPTDCGMEDGRIDIVIEGDPTNFEFTINGGQTWIADNSFNFLPPGTYTAGVRRNNGQCETILTDPTILVEPPSPVILNVSATQPTDCNLNNGSILITASAGIGSFEYSINGGIDWGNSGSFDGLSNGDYDILIRNSDGTCQVGHNISIQLIEPSPPSLIDVVLAPPANCTENTGSINLVAEGNGDLLYSIDAGQTWVETSTFSNLSVGVYQIWLSNLNGTCTTDFGAFILGGTGVPNIIEVEAIDPSDCSLPNGSINIEANGPGITLQYSIDGGISWSENPIFNNLSAGIYEIMVSNADFSCPVSFLHPIELISPALATIDTILISPPSGCQQTDGSIIITLEGEPQGFEFSIDQGVSWQTDNAFNNVSGGTYLVWARTQGSTCIINYSETIILNNPPEVTDLSPVIISPTACGINDGVIHIDYVGQALSYSIDGGITWQPEPVFSQLGPDEYSILVNGPGLSCPLIHEFSISITYPVATISLDVEVINATDCEEDTGSISITPPDNTEYEYSIDGGLNYSAYNLFSNLIPGEYPIRIRSVSSLCEWEHTSLIEIIELPNPEIIDIHIVNPEGCETPTGSIEIIAESDGNVEYSINQGQNWQLTNGLFTQLNTGSYSIWVRNENSNCALIHDEQIELTATNGGQIEVELDATICQGESYHLGDDYYTETGDYMATFSGQNGCDSIIFLTLSVQDTFWTAIHESICTGDYFIFGNDTLTNAGFHIVSLSSNTGCDSTIIVNLDVIPPDTSLIEAQICAGEIFELFDSSFTEAGHYYLPVVNALECFDVLHLNLNVSPLPTFDSLNIELPDGCGSQDGKIVLWGLDPSILLSIDQGETWQTDSIFSDLGAGIYNLLMLDQNSDCSRTIPVELVNTVVPIIASIDSIAPSACSIEDGLITINPFEDGEDYLYSIDGGQSWYSDNHFPNLGIGNYQVIMGATNLECFSDTMLVVLDAPVDFQIQTMEVIPPICANDANGSIQVAIVGNGVYNFSWSDGSDGPFLSGIEAGSYALTVTDDNGCSDSLDIVLTDPPPFFVELPKKEVFLCAGQTLSYPLNQPNFHYEWSLGALVVASDEDLEVSNSGVYHFLAENEVGCLFTDSILATELGTFFTPRFLLPSEGLIDESIFAVEVSWPAPDSIRWLVNENEIEVVDTFLNQIELQFFSAGVYTIGMEIHLGDCVEILEKEITIYSDPGQLGGNPGNGFTEILEYVLFPNPNTGQFQIKVVLDQPIPLQIRLYRDNGILVESRALSGAATFQEIFSMTNASPGNYIAQIQTASEWRSINFIIQ